MRRTSVLLWSAILASGAVAVHAVDGVIEINQAKVMALGGFPYAITAGGSYRLTSNLDIVAGGQENPQSRAGIQVVVAGEPSTVDLDLNGFTIEGPIQCTIDAPPFDCEPAVVGSASGIIVSSGTLRVHDGAVQGFAGNCIDASFVSGGGQIRNVDVKWCHNGVVTAVSTVENVTTFMNRAQGISAIFSVLHRIMSRFNGDDGISIQASVLRDCTSTVNSGDEIATDGASVVVDCTTATP